MHNPGHSYGRWRLPRQRDVPGPKVGVDNLRQMMIRLVRAVLQGSRPRDYSPPRRSSDEQLHNAPLYSKVPLKGPPLAADAGGLYSFETYKQAEPAIARRHDCYNKPRCLTPGATPPRLGAMSPCRHRRAREDHRTQRTTDCYPDVVPFSSNALPRALPTRHTAVFVKIDPLGGEAVGKDHW